MRGMHKSLRGQRKVANGDAACILSLAKPGVARGRASVGELVPTQSQGASNLRRCVGANVSYTSAWVRLTRRSPTSDAMGDASPSGKDGRTCPILISQRSLRRPQRDDGV